MKKIYFMFISLLATTALVAQPTLTESNHAYTIGELFTNNFWAWDGTPPSTGADQTWDYSSITSTGTQTLEYKDPASCVSYTDFPGATIGGENAGGAQYAYNIVSSSGIENLGYHITGAGVSQFYSDSEMQMQYPFTYMDSFSDDFYSTFVNGVTWYRYGTTTVEAVGYGTLSMPTGDLTDVLLVKTTQDYKDSSSSTIVNYLSEIYAFYKPGYHNSILGMTSFDVDGSVSETGTFDSNPALNFNENKLSNLTLYPNPVNSVLQLNGATTEIDEIAIVDVSGRLVYKTQEVATEIEVESLPTGLYYLEILSGEDKVVKKFIKR